MGSLQTIRFAGFVFLSILLIDIGFGLTQAHGQANDPDLVHWFLSEAPGKWEQYEKWCGSLQGKVAVSAQTDSNPPSTLTGTYKNAPNFQLELVEDHGPEGRSYAKVLNPDYSFSVEKTKDKNWTLVNFSLADGSSESNPFVASPVDKSRPGDLVHVGTAGSLSELIQQPNFKVIRATWEKEGDASYVRIDFDNQHPVQEGKFFPIQSGTLQLDPAKCWSLNSANLVLAFQGGIQECRISMTSRQGKSGFPLPEIMQEERSTILEGGQKGTSKYGARYDLDSRPDSARGEFLLTAFGLPEPANLLKPGSRNSWFYAVIFILGLLALSFTFWNMGKTAKA